jgi:hypothetical protein
MYCVSVYISCMLESVSTGHRQHAALFTHVSRSAADCLPYLTQLVGTLSLTPTEQFCCFLYPLFSEGPFSHRQYEEMESLGYNGEQPAEASSYKYLKIIVFPGHSNGILRKRFTVLPRATRGFDVIMTACWVGPPHPHSLKTRTFWSIKHSHSAWVDDADSSLPRHFSSTCLIKFICIESKLQRAKQRCAKHYSNA